MVIYKVAWLKSGSSVCVVDILLIDPKNGSEAKCCAYMHLREQVVMTSAIEKRPSESTKKA